jgi:hypothetical protein
VRGQPHAPAALPKEKFPYSHFGKTHSQQKELHILLSRIEPKIFNSEPVTMWTELPQILGAILINECFLCFSRHCFFFSAQERICTDAKISCTQFADTLRPQSMSVLQILTCDHVTFRNSNANSYSAPTVRDGIHGLPSRAQVLARNPVRASLVWSLGKAKVLKITGFLDFVHRPEF